MKLLPMGISNQLFYYTCAGEELSFDFCYHFDLQEKLDRRALSAAAAKALQNFPEFAIRPVVHDNKLWAVPNHGPVALLEDEPEKTRYYGTEETGGYLFYFRCREKGFSFPYFHGMTDFYGVWHFLRTLCYYYALEKGLSPRPDEFVRTAPPKGMTEDEKEWYDPYVKFASPLKDAGAEGPQPAPAAFEIPESYYSLELPYSSGYEIRCPLKDILQLVKERGTSVVPFLAVLTSRAIASAYPWDGTPIRIMASANMRKYYQTNTMANFSDATFLSYDRELASLSTEEQAVRFRQILKGQMTKEHFNPLIAKKVQMVRSMAEADVSLTEWNRRFTQSPGEGAASPMTVALTYPGSLDLPEEYAPLLGRVTRSLCSRGVNVSFCVFVSTYGDTMYIRSCQRFDSDAVMQGIRKALSQAGLPTKMEKLPLYYGNQVIATRLQHV